MPNLLRNLADIEELSTPLAYPIDYDPTPISLTKAQFTPQSVRSGEELFDPFRRRDHDQKPRVRLTASFAQPTNPLAKTEVLPNLEYFNYRSGKNVDMFCAGYSRDGSAGLTNSNDCLDNLTDGAWSFSALQFNELRKSIESATTWKYSGGLDAIIFNLSWSDSKNQLKADFDTAICIQFEIMKSEGVINSPATYLESLFRYAEMQDARDPTWGFSDYLGAQVIRPLLVRLAFAILPATLQKELSGLRHAAVRDISRPKG